MNLQLRKTIERIIKDKCKQQKNNCEIKRMLPKDWTIIRISCFSKELAEEVEKKISSLE